MMNENNEMSFEQEQNEKDKNNTFQGLYEINQNAQSMSTMAQSLQKKDSEMMEEEQMFQNEEKDDTPAKKLNFKEEIKEETPKEPEQNVLPNEIQDYFNEEKNNQNEIVADAIEDQNQYFEQDNISLNISHINSFLIPALEQLSLQETANTIIIPEPPQEDAGIINPYENQNINENNNEQLNQGGNDNILIPIQPWDHNEENEDMEINDDMLTDEILNMPPPSTNHEHNQNFNNLFAGLTLNSSSQIIYDTSQFCYQFYRLKI